MHRFVSGYERRKSSQWEMDTGEWNQVGLELVQVDIERAGETKGSRDRRDNLRNETIQVGEARLRNTQVFLADVKDGLVVNLIETDDVHTRLLISYNNIPTHHEGAVGVFEGRMSRQHRVIGLHN